MASCIVILCCIAKILCMFSLCAVFCVLLCGRMGQINQSICHVHTTQSGIRALLPTPSGIFGGVDGGVSSNKSITNGIAAEWFVLFW